MCTQLYVTTPSTIYSVSSLNRNVYSKNIIHSAEQFYFKRERKHSTIWKQLYSYLRRAFKPSKFNFPDRRFSRTHRRAQIYHRHSAATFLYIHFRTFRVFLKSRQKTLRSLPTTANLTSWAPSLRQTWRYNVSLSRAGADRSRVCNFLIIFSHLLCELDTRELQKQRLNTHPYPSDTYPPTKPRAFRLRNFPPKTHPYFGRNAT